MRNANKPLPSQELLSHLFEYDESNPALPLKWKNPPKRKGHLVGKAAGTKGSCYCFIKINREKYCLHRIVWMYHTGRDPGLLTVDHRDRNSFNNCIYNLREADGFNQMRNRYCKGYKYRPDVDKYQALLRVNGKQKSLGYYSTPEEAVSAYNSAAAEYHGEFFCPAVAA